MSAEVDLPESESSSDSEEEGIHELHPFPSPRRDFDFVIPALSGH